MGGGTLSLVSDIRSDEGLHPKSLGSSHNRPDNARPRQAGRALEFHRGMPRGRKVLILHVIVPYDAAFIDSSSTLKEF